MTIFKALEHLFDKSTKAFNAMIFWILIRLPTSGELILPFMRDLLWFSLKGICVISALVLLSIGLFVVAVKSPLILIVLLLLFLF